MKVLVFLYIALFAACRAEDPVLESDVRDMTFYRGQHAHRSRGLGNVPSLQCRLGACEIELSSVYCARAIAWDWQCHTVVNDALAGHRYELQNTGVKCQGFANAMDDRILPSSCFLTYDLYVFGPPEPRRVAVPEHNYDAPAGETATRSPHKLASNVKHALEFMGTSTGMLALLAGVACAVACYAWVKKGDCCNRARDSEDAELCAKALAALRPNLPPVLVSDSVPLEAEVLVSEFADSTSPSSSASSPVPQRRRTLRSNESPIQTAPESTIQTAPEFGLGAGAKSGGADDIGPRAQTRPRTFHEEVAYARGFDLGCKIKVLEARSGAPLGAAEGVPLGPLGAALKSKNVRRSPPVNIPQLMSRSHQSSIAAGPMLSSLVSRGAMTVPKHLLVSGGGRSRRTPKGAPAENEERNAEVRPEEWDFVEPGIAPSLKPPPAPQTNLDYTTATTTVSFPNDDLPRAPSGDANTAPSGDANTAPSGDANTAPSGDANTAPSGNPNTAAKEGVQGSGATLRTHGDPLTLAPPSPEPSLPFCVQPTLVQGTGVRRRTQE